ncbi:hypothetical protein B0H10DRAFT_1987078 [Mycena sp. CBHHK59/15]|nr:hypothetical protein B0H10DRAFT_1987078 [Mycena sp. CBHHK59/15]
MSCLAALSIAANVASVGSFVLGDAREAAEKLASVYTTIIDNARVLEETELATMSRRAEDEWNATSKSLRERFNRNGKIRKQQDLHIYILNCVIKLKDKVIRTSANARLQREIEAAQERLAARQLLNNPILHSSPSPTSFLVYPPNTAPEQDITHLGFPAPVNQTDVMGAWNVHDHTNDGISLNPFTDGT